MNTEYKSDIEDNLLDFLKKTRSSHLKAVYDAIRESVNATELLVRNNMSAQSFNSSSASGRKRSTGKIYTLPLERAIQTGVFNDNGMPTGLISILGNRNQDDGTWRLRFFNDGTVERFISPKGGEKHSIGRIEPTNFFNDALTSVNEVVPNIIQRAIDKVMTENK